MTMKRCPICGEKYSDTYRECPFCEEEEYEQQESGRRRAPTGRRTTRSRQYSLITPTLIILIVIMAALLVYLLYGDKLSDKKKDDVPSKPGTESVIPSEPVGDEPGKSSGTSGEGVMPEGSSGTTNPGNTDLTYGQLSQLPGGLNISKEDFTLFRLGETATISVSGGNGSYTWISEDDGIASVDQNGKVVAVSGGTTNVLVTDGEKKAVCIVRVKATGSAVQTPPENTPVTSGLKAGAGEVVNGGNGVRVRSGPSTNHEVLATVPNGASIQIVESAGDGWYKIKFAGAGGVMTAGYMKGDYLANK